MHANHLCYFRLARLGRRRRSQRLGTIVVLSALMLVVVISMMAFAVDIGYMYVVEAELQRSADCASLAAITELTDQDALSGDSNPWARAASARSFAIQYVADNYVAGASPLITDDDVDVGYIANPFDPDEQMTFDDPAKFNAVTVRVPRRADRNGEVPLIFARMLGVDSFAAEATATAMVLSDISGFQTPLSGNVLPVIPFALDQESWDQLLDGSGSDDWAWDEGAGGLVAEGDGILEIDLYPQPTGAPGNRGTVNIGTKNNSTSTVSRQILHGISTDDLAFHGGSLEIDESGELQLGGNPGISAGFKDELAAIKGEPRIIPIYSGVTGNGNNAVYTIVKWVGIRIVDVKLTGKNKRVIAQPAQVFTEGAIGSTGNSVPSNFIYTPIWLAR